MSSVPTLLLNGCETYGGLGEDRRGARCPWGVTTVAQVLPFIDLMDLCQPAEGS